MAANNAAMPPAPLMAAMVRQSIGNGGTYKSARLAEIRKSFPALVFGVGDQLSDARAYLENGMTAYLIPRRLDKTRDMRNLADEIRKMPDKDRIQAVWGWRQIEEGVFDGKRFPPESYAIWLRQQAEKNE